MAPSPKIVATPLFSLDYMYSLDYCTLLSLIYITIFHLCALLSFIYIHCYNLSMYITIIYLCTLLSFVYMHYYHLFMYMTIITISNEHPAQRCASGSGCRPLPRQSPLLSSLWILCNRWITAHYCHCCTLLSFIYVHSYHSSMYISISTIHH
jgi:hypothetical protein